MDDLFTQARLWGKRINLVNRIGCMPYLLWKQCGMLGRSKRSQYLFCSSHRLMQELRKIAIGVCTRGRPEGLLALLSSFVPLKIPGGYFPVFIIIENDAAKSLQSYVDQFAKELSSGEVIYEQEPRLGIPFARNAILNTALKHECDLLAMADDDEVVDSDWLMALHQELSARKLDLVGGPVRILPVPAEASKIERWIWRGLVHRFANLEARALKKHRIGQDHRVVIVTSSWLVSLDFVRAHSLHFDNSLGFSGGSDTRFYRQFIASQGRSGWAPQAIVHEHWPLSRLRPRYQFCRARDQSMSHYRNSFPATTFSVVIQSIFFVGFKVAAALFLFPVAVLDGGKSSVHALRSLGFAVGRTLALFGAKSRQYANASPEMQGDRSQNTHTDP